MGGGSGVAVSGFRQVLLACASYLALMLDVCCICSTITLVQGMWIRMNTIYLYSIETVL